MFADSSSRTEPGTYKMAPKMLVSLLFSFLIWESIWEHKHPEIKNGNTVDIQDIATDSPRNTYSELNLCYYFVLLLWDFS